MVKRSVFSRRGLLWPVLAAWLGGLVAMALQAPAVAAATLDLADDRGTVHHLAASPRRIVTLLPSLTESVWALGGGARLVGVDRYSNWPEALNKLPRLGGLDDVQIEAIAALKPDVVLASTSARSLDRLEALGFTVIRLKSETQADVRRTLGLLARMLGTPAEGERTWAAIDARIVAAAQRVPPAVRGKRVYFEIGGGPWAAGTSSFIGELLARLALGNIVPASMGPFPKLNPEFVLRERPDLVMGPRREADDMPMRPGWASLAALQQRQRCAFETPQYELLIRPGPRMGEAAEALADCLQALPQRAGGKL